MNKPMTFLLTKACFAFLLLFALVFVSGPNANAQSVGGAFQGMGNTDEPIQIEADNLEVIDNQNTALLTGNVSVVQGTTIFKASRIKVFYARGENARRSRSGIQRIEASGKVAVRSKDAQATADKATIDMIGETVVLSGNVYMSQGKNIATGCQVIVNLRTNVSNVKSCNSSTSSSSGRVRLLLDPKSNN